jgi:hypothetical protein
MISEAVRWVTMVRSFTLLTEKIAQPFAASTRRIASQHAPKGRDQTGRETGAAELEPGGMT